MTAARSLELEREYGREWSALPSISRVDFKRGFPWVVEAAEASDSTAPTCWRPCSICGLVVLGEVLDRFALAQALAPATLPLVSVETFLGVTFQFGRDRVLKVLFVWEDLAVSLSDQALQTVRANVPSTFRQFEFIAGGRPANALVPDALPRWLR